MTQEYLVPKEEPLTSERSGGSSVSEQPRELQPSCQLCGDNKILASLGEKWKHTMEHLSSAFICPVKDCWKPFGTKILMADHLRDFHQNVLDSLPLQCLMIGSIPTLAKLQELFETRSPNEENRYSEQLLKCFGGEPIAKKKFRSELPNEPRSGQS